MTGNKAAQERLEVFNRVAAHQKTTDNPGVIPDPVIGGLINFIDAARPIASFLGPQTLDAGTCATARMSPSTPTVARQADGRRGRRREGRARLPEDD